MKRKTYLIFVMLSLLFLSCGGGGGGGGSSPNTAPPATGKHLICRRERPGQVIMGKCQRGDNLQYLLVNNGRGSKEDRHENFRCYQSLLPKRA